MERVRRRGSEGEGGNRVDVDANERFFHKAHNLWWKGSARALETQIDIVCE
jgi:hypothetical protein